MKYNKQQPSQDILQAYKELGVYLESKRKQITGARNYAKLCDLCENQVYDIEKGRRDYGIINLLKYISKLENVNLNEVLTILKSIV